MASIKNLGNNKYRIFVCDGFKPDGRVNRISKTIFAKSERDAEKQAQAMEVDFKRGQQIQFSSTPTFSELADKWRESWKSPIWHSRRRNAMRGCSKTLCFRTLAG